VIRPGGWVLALCLVLVALITLVTPDPATDVRRRWNDVGVGQWDQGDEASVRVTRVRLTRSVVDENDRRLDSEATFVVLDFEVGVRQEQRTFTQITLHTRDDRAYEPRSEVAGIDPTAPGFSRRGSMVFEVPDDRVAGAELWVERDGQAFDVFAPAVRVDLGFQREPAVELGPVAVAQSVVQVTP